MSKRVRNLLLIVFCFFLVGSFSTLQVRATEEDSEPYPVPDDNLVVYRIEEGFLTITDNGYERVYYDYDTSMVRIEMYDAEFNKTGGLSIPMELSYWGGFYSDSDFNFLVEGEANEDENDDAEVVRVIKYDKNWNRLGAASITRNLSLFGGDVRYPFDSLSVKMAEKDGILYIVTGREGYVDPGEGQGHQGLLMMAVDIQNMTGSVIECDFMHSFAQYIRIVNDDIYLLELSEGWRCTSLKKIETTSGKYNTKFIHVFDYGGHRTSAWAVPTYAYVNDLEISSENILGLGTSIDQSQYDNYTKDTSFNIYLTVTPLSDFSKDATTVKWLTEYNNDGKSFSGPSMVKINDNRFMIMWGESGETDETINAEDVLDRYKVHYVFVDGAGNKISKEFVANAPLSNCHPILSGDKIVYYASNDLTVNFYTIDANTGSFTKKVYPTFNGISTWNLSDHVLRIAGNGPAKSSEEALFSDFFRFDIEKIIIEDGVTEISEGMFSGLYRLREVDLAETVEYVGDEAFEGNGYAIEKVYVKGKNTAFGKDVFNTGFYYSGVPSISATIICWPGSVAEQYAKDNEIKYEYFTVPTEVTLDRDKLTIPKGESQTLTASVIPKDFFDQSIIWKSSNPGIATVDSNGVVKAVSAGKTVITARAFGGVEKTCEVKVIVNPETISIGADEHIMYFGNVKTLTVTITPSDVTEKNIIWTSSNTDIATVYNGVVRAKNKFGKTTITAKTVNGLKATYDITVFADNTPGNIFADIKADSWMYTPAKSVYDKGYMTGTGTIEGRVIFSPNTDMNRTMFVQALYSMDGKPEVTYEQKFSDVMESAWYAKAVTWASNNGVVAGNPDGTFGINGKATREQLALMFYKYAVSKGFDVTVKPSTTLDGFTDANKVDSWALTAVKWAVERGIISGKGNASTGYRIDPIGKATRIECAAMMNKFSEIYANAPKMGIEDIEEPFALPEEEIEDLPVPADETEDVIIDDEEDETEDEDVPSEDEKETDEAEADSEEEAETDTE